MRVLVVDDEVELTELIARGLRADGHHVTQTHDGIAAITAAMDGDVDVAIVDLMLPGMSGFELSRRLKELDPTIAVILLTARHAVDDRVRGLDSGADDYMTKPFDFAELSARIRAVRRRDTLTVQTRIHVGALRIDLSRNQVQVGEKAVPLSRTEAEVLRCLASRADTTVPRALILKEVWVSAEHIDSNVVDQYVSYLRRKLEMVESGVRILTERGVGFRLVTV